MKVTFIPIVTGDLDTLTKELIQGLEDLEIRGRVETIQTKIGQIIPTRNHHLMLVWKAQKGVK